MRSQRIRKRWNGSKSRKNKEEEKKKTYFAEKKGQQRDKKQQQRQKKRTQRKMMKHKRKWSKEGSERQKMKAKNSRNIKTTCFDTWADYTSIGLGLAPTVIKQVN